MSALRKIDGTNVTGNIRATDILMTWHDLLFAHWSFPAEWIRPLIPAPLELDLFDGRAWVGVVPFYMTGVRPKAVRFGRWLEDFPEINVRTYVKHEAHAGVWFFSLDTPNLLAIAAARSIFHLPYLYSRITCISNANGVEYSSRRMVRKKESFIAQYWPTKAIELSKPGSLEYWLTERYCLFSATSRSVYRGDIVHQPWPLQSAKAEISLNTMLRTARLETPTVPPLLHFAKKIDVVAKPLVRVASRR